MKKYDLGIDMGTSNTKIFSAKGEHLLNMPAVVAVKKNNKKIIGIGKKAYNMLGKAPNSIIVKKPISGGVVTDFELNKLMIRKALSLILKNNFKKPRICICVHSFMTNFEKLTLKHSIFSNESDKIFLIDESIASGLGAGLKISPTQNSLIVNIGGGTTDIAVISSNKLIISQSIKTGSETLDNIICKNMLRNYNTIIGKATAEKIKKKAATLKKPSRYKKFKINGKDKTSGLPKTIEVSQLDICQTMEKTITKISDKIEDVFKIMPKDISKDIEKKGILLTGGGCLLPGMGEFIYKNTGLPTKTAKNPINCAAFGALKSFNLLKDNYSSNFLSLC